MVHVPAPVKALTVADIALGWLTEQLLSELKVIVPLDAELAVRVVDSSKLKELLEALSERVGVAGVRVNETGTIVLSADFLILTWQAPELWRAVTVNELSEVREALQEVEVLEEAKFIFSEVVNVVAC